jgi:SagB-type dehydrogenase family enzyme
VSPFVTDAIGIALGPLVKSFDMTFEDVLAARRSRRVLAPLDLESLAYVLASIGRVRDWSYADDGCQLTHRAAPSAGGRHPCELAVVVNAVLGIESGLWWFDALRCMLVPQPAGDRVLRASEAVAAATALETGPPAAVFVVAHFQRTLSRYPAGSALVWRDAGAMLAMLHLAATAAGVSSCIAGTSGVLVRDGENLVADVGALVLGGPT